MSPRLIEVSVFVCVFDHALQYTYVRMCYPAGWSGKLLRALAPSRFRAERSSRVCLCIFWARGGGGLCHALGFSRFSDGELCRDRECHSNVSQFESLQVLHDAEKLQVRFHAVDWCVYRTHTCRATLQWPIETCVIIISGHTAAFPMSLRAPSFLGSGAAGKQTSRLPS